MAQRTMKVCIGEAGTEVGTLRFESQGNREFSSFQYDNGWIENERGFAIAPSMPLVPTPIFFKKEGETISPLPSPLSDTVPDSWGRNIIRRDVRENRQDTSPLSELDYLLAVDDFSRMGALRLRSEDDATFLAGEPGGCHEIPPVLKLDELGKSIESIEKRNPMTAAALKRLRQVGSALGGARPKCSVIDTDGSLLIAKFTSHQDTHDVERAEVLTLNLAQACGLSASVARLDMSDGLPVALIRRFDRNSKGARIPYISAQTMLGAADATSGTYTQLAEAIRQVSDDPKRDMSELFDRIGFTILVSNVDDHLKNHGFLYVGNGRWRLSHMFDVNPAPERHRELKTPISEISGADASIEALIEHAAFFDLTSDAASKAVRRMATTISETWETMARERGMDRASVNVYRPAFEHDEMKIALALG
jgi:serine/threonine-protein kinase HipA